LKNYFIEEYKKRLEEWVSRVLDSLKKGKPPYGQFTMSYKEAVEATIESGYDDIPFDELEEKE
jgi:hypothetical protein